mmetsp:Transcript_23740/g.36526  ORF Transcript_23740/g.36526 Transcript_23740/m.36526 type:complete len:108 (-) Transcript_23740:316-639(-)
MRCAPLHRRRTGIPHGLRATGATLLREHGFSRDVVELLLAHKERNPTTAAYHHHELADERRRALQYLSEDSSLGRSAQAVLAKLRDHRRVNAERTGQLLEFSGRGLA